MRSFVFLAIAGVSLGQWVPSSTPTYQMNTSTIIMPCNNSGFTDPQTTKGWGIIDFDWSNGKSIWVKNRPMNDEEVLQQQVVMSTSASLGQTVWVYRGSMWAYPWYTSVRKTLEDPAYSDWYLKFKKQGPWYSSKCDTNYDPPLCSDYYHNQEQSPGYPKGDGDCAAPNCNCGDVPCGFYIWNHSSTTVVHGQTFQDWFVHTYMLDYQGLSPLVSGMYWDDYFPTSGGFPDPFPNMTQDMGLTPSEQKAIGISYQANMAVLIEKTLAAGKFAWQLFWNGQSDPHAQSGCCTSPIVHEGKACATTLRNMCKPDAPPQKRAMTYAFSPGGCSGDPASLPMWEQDLANFLLIRGDFAWLGHGWLGCSHEYQFPDMLNWDYGEPTALCYETATNSGIFKRDWTKATVQMDCNTWNSTITMK